MGTLYHVQIHPGKANKIKAIQSEIQSDIDKLLKEINLSLSTYISDSIISQFNSSKAGENIKLDKHFLKVFKLSSEIYAHTKGAFDPSVGPLVNLWGFGPQNDTRFSVPSEKDVTTAKALVKWPSFTLDTHTQTLKKGISDSYLDFSAVAKGYGVDQVANLLKANGIKHFYVEIGGEIKVRGFRDAKQKPWRIGLETPQSGLKQDIMKVLNLKNISVASSGDYRNFFELNGVTYSHTLNPKTGHPVEHQTASVTVLHKGLCKCRCLGHRIFSFRR